MSGKQCRPWTDAAFCGVWSGSTLFAQACPSQCLGKISLILKKMGLLGGEKKNEQLTKLHKDRLLLVSIFGIYCNVL